MSPETRPAYRQCIACDLAIALTARRGSARSGPAARHTGGVVTRPLPGSIPDEPGSYQFVDADGRVLYVGKAKSLRPRLNSYFQDPANLAPRTAQMVAARPTTSSGWWSAPRPRPSCSSTTSSSSSSPGSTSG